MLFAFYASFRWATSKHHIARTTIFVVLASVSSAFFASSSLTSTAYAAPASVLSFPLYSEQPSRLWLSYYRVHFLTWIIYPNDAFPLILNPFVFATLLFLAVNSLSAALGYWINRKHIFPASHAWAGLLLLIFLAVPIIVTGDILYNSRAWHSIDGYHVYANREYDAWRFWMFGFTWLTVVSGDFFLFRPNAVKRVIWKDLMNNFEIVAGALVFTFSFLSLLFIICSGVVPSRQFPGHYEYSGFAGLSRLYLFPLILIVGFLVMVHGVYGNRSTESWLSVIVELWGVPAWFFVALTLYDGSSPYIKGSIMNDLVWMALSVAPGLCLGIALMWDGLKTKLPSKRYA
jgi:hypothetical protein